MRSRFDLIQLPLDLHGSNLSEFPVFCEQAAKWLPGVLKALDRKAYRIASVREGLLADIAGADKDAIASRLVICPPFFRQTPFEWDWRVASNWPRRFGDTEESINTIITAKRQVVTLTDVSGASETFDSIRADFDISTSQHDTLDRFGNEECRQYLLESGNWHREVANDFLNFIGGMGL